MSASSSTSSRSSRFAISTAARPPASRSPAGSSTNSCRAVWRYCRRHITRSCSSTASTTTAPGCSRLIRLNCSACRRAGGRSSRSATTQSSRCRSRLEHRPARTSAGRRGARRLDPADATADASAMDSESVRSPHDVVSLTKHEAATRSALLEVQRYDIAVDMTGLLEGERSPRSARSPSPAPSPGATTFVDVRRRRPPGHPQRRAARRRRPPPTAGSRCPRWPPTTSSSSPAHHQHRHRRGHPAHGRPDRQARLRLDQPSSPTRPGACGPASTSPTSRRPHRFVGDRPRRRGWSPPTAPRVDRGRRPPRRRGSGPTPTPRACRRTSWWSTPARSTRCAASTTATTSASTAASRCARSWSATSTSWSTSPARAWPSSASGSPARSRRSATTRSSCPTSAAPWRTGAAST